MRAIELQDSARHLLSSDLTLNQLYPASAPTDNLSARSRSGSSARSISGADAKNSVASGEEKAAGGPSASKQSAPLLRSHTVATSTGLPRHTASAQAQTQTQTQTQAQAQAQTQAQTHTPAPAAPASSSSPTHVTSSASAASATPQQQKQ